MTKILPRKRLIELKEENHPLFKQKKKAFYNSEEGRNSIIKYGHYIADITEEELEEYENAYVEAINKLNTDDIVR
ncbi:MAG: hypothetical protein ACTSQE_12645 [Candidatus Heimdallarchaeaceae archaeon]